MKAPMRPTIVFVLPVPGGLWRMDLSARAFEACRVNLPLDQAEALSAESAKDSVCLRLVDLIGSHGAVDAARVEGQRGGR